MQSLDRIMQIIKMFISKDPTHYFSIGEIARECNLPNSSVHRLLQAMIEHNMIHQDSEYKLYSLGTVWLEYGLKMYDTLDYISILRPELEELMKTVQASVYLSKFIENESIIIERIDCVNQSIHVHKRLGTRTPVQIGPENRIMLAHMSEEKANKIIKTNIKEKDQKLFYDDLTKIKLDGYKVEHEDRGISTIAVPVLSHKGFGEVGAISIRLESSDLNTQNFQKITNDVLQTGNKVSWKVGYGLI